MPLSLLLIPCNLIDKWASLDSSIEPPSQGTLGTIHKGRPQKFWGFVLTQSPCPMSQLLNLISVQPLLPLKYRHPLWMALNLKESQTLLHFTAPDPSLFFAPA